MSTNGLTGWRKALWFIGIHVPEGKRWRMSFLPRFFALAGGLAVFFVVANVGMIRYSESPRFCNSCHIMTPYYNAWKGSAHKEVACVECHYAPVGNMSEFQSFLFKKYQNLAQVAKYVTRTYSSKPFAEVEDASCLRSGCHSTRLLKGKVTAKLGISKFDHRPHLSEARRGRHLRCVSCHSQVVMGKHIQVTFDACFLCHFKGKGEGRDLKPLGGCLGCHEVPSKVFKIGNMSYNHREFVSKRGVSCLTCHMDVVQGTGDASKDRCFTCHNQPEKLAKYEDISFMHEKHVTKHGVACFHCHTEIKHGFPEPQKVIRLQDAGVGISTAAPAGHEPGARLDCSLCHSGKHDAPQGIYNGTAGKILGVAAAPSPMFKANVACVGCHFDESSKGLSPKGWTARPSTTACVKCHGSGFQGIFEETQAELHGMLDKLEAKQAAAEKAVTASGLAEAEKKRWATELAKTAEGLRFLRAGHGEHNIYLAASALTRVDEVLAGAGAAAGAALADESGSPLISGSFCATLCHRSVGVKVPPEMVKAFGKTMPHKMHAEMNGCRKCHDIGAHKKVPLKKNVRKEVCDGCHAGG